jgi:hypothetical protein
MPFDVAGNFTRVHNFQEDRDNGIKILAARMDAEFDNFATGMNAVFFRDGRVPMQGDLRMNVNRITGISDGTVGSPALKFQTDASTGPYLDGLSRYGISVNGVQRGVFTTAGLDVTGVISQGGVPLSSVYAPSAAPVFTNPVTINGASGSLRQLVYATAGVNAAEITLLTDNGTLRHNAATGHRFDIGGTEKFRVDSSGAKTAALTISSATEQITLLNGSSVAKAYVGTSGLFGSAGADDLRIRSEASNIVLGFSGAETARFSNSGTFTYAGSAVWIATNKMQLQHDGANGYLRSATGALVITTAGVNRLTVQADGNTALSGVGYSTNTAGNYGISHTRAASPGQVGFHMYNGGGTCEWEINQPAGGISHELRFSTQVAGAYTTRMSITPTGDVNFGATTLNSLMIRPQSGNVEYFCGAHTFKNGAGTTLAQIGTDSSIPFMTIGGGRVFKHSNTSYASSNITYSTAAPSGGIDGDIWFQYS